MGREEIKKEVDDDLKKPYDHLLVDIHEELLSGGAPEYKMMHAQKRIMSLFAKMGIDSIHLQRQMYYLTLAIVALTGAVVFLTILQLFIFHK